MSKFVCSIRSELRFYVCFHACYLEEEEENEGEKKKRRSLYAPSQCSTRKSGSIISLKECSMITYFTNEKSNFIFRLVL